jgi:hypothetical protein
MILVNQKLMQRSDLSANEDARLRSRALNHGNPESLIIENKPLPSAHARTGELGSLARRSLGTTKNWWRRLTRP